MAHLETTGSAGLLLAADESIEELTLVIGREEEEEEEEEVEVDDEG